MPYLNSQDFRAETAHTPNLPFSFRPAVWLRHKENTNGLIRRYLPKGTDFNEIDEKKLQNIQDKLNNRPRKIIGYKTPKEILEFELNFVA